MPTVHHAARRLTRTSADAQDAAQVALLEVLRCAGHYGGRGSLRGWAGKIAMRSVVRWSRRHGTPMLQEHDPDAQPDTSIGDSRHEALPRPLEAYLDELPEAQRTALILRHSMGCTLREIVEITESPLPTVRSRVTTAMQRVRKAIRRDVRFGAGTEVGA